MIRGWLPAAAAGAVLGGLAGAVTTERPADVTLFARAGQDVLTGHLAGVYGGPDNQAGPLQVVLTRLLLGADGGGPTRPVLVLLDALLAALVAAVAHRRAGPRRAAVAVGYTALWLIAPMLWGGHPLELLIPVLWLVAAQRGGRTAALALAGAAAVAPWGVLGWPVVLRRGAGRSSAVPLVAAGALTAAVYAPFLLAGRGTAARHVWPVDRHTLLHVVLPHLHRVGWDFRLAQGLLVVTALALLARRMPASPVRGPLLVTAAGFLRVVTDPVSLGYYWLPAGFGALALIVTVRDLRSRAGAGALAVAYLAWAAPPRHLVAAALIGLAVLAVAFDVGGYSRQMRSSSTRNRAAGSAVRGPSR